MNSPHGSPAFRLPASPVLNFGFNPSSSSSNTSRRPGSYARLLLAGAATLIGFVYLAQSAETVTLLHDAPAAMHNKFKSFVASHAVEQDPLAVLEPEWEWARDISIVYTVSQSGSTHFAVNR